LLYVEEGWPTRSPDGSVELTAWPTRDGVWPVGSFGSAAAFGQPLDPAVAILWPVRATLLDQSRPASETTRRPT